MIIHSITPIEYLMEQQPFPTLECRAFAQGFVQGFDSADGFVIDRIISTDPAAYLQNGFSPGDIYK